MKVDVNGHDEDWLFLFKNETHNHPTEIEPFGGAATCLGGAIRDPLSGRSYVYQAMRVTGSGDPTRAGLPKPLAGKLPQRKLVTTAAAGLLRLRQPDRSGHRPGAGDLSSGLMWPSAWRSARSWPRPRADHVRRETPAPGDKVILLGGRTGRDGMRRRDRRLQGAQRRNRCEPDGAEVQKGNAPVERKLQRLFRRA